MSETKVSSLGLSRAPVRICYSAHMSMLFLMFFAAGCGPLPDELMQQLQGGYEAEPMPAWQPRVAIVVLGGRCAAQLQFDGRTL